MRGKGKRRLREEGKGIFLTSFKQSATVACSTKMYCSLGKHNTARPQCSVDADAALAATSTTMRIIPSNVLILILSLELCDIGLGLVMFGLGLELIDLA